MPDKVPPRSRPAANPGRDQQDAPRRSPNALDASRAPLQEPVRPSDEPGEEKPAATVSAPEAPAPENGHLHHELPSHPGVPLASR